MSRLQGMSFAVAITWAGMAVHAAPGPGHDAGAIGDPPAEAVLRIGPVAGLTESWHAAPDRTAIPVGTVVSFSIDAPADAVVEWSGAIEFFRGAESSIAVCPLVKTGLQQVSVTVRNGVIAQQHESLLDVVDVSPQQVFVSSLRVNTTRLRIDESLPRDELNELTVGLFFGPSIAPLRETGPGRFRTSIGRPVEMSVTTVPPGFAPLMEWRVDGEPKALGAASALPIMTIGTHAMSVGPPAAEQAIEVETYAVDITSHEPDDLIPQGVPVTFTAVTDPPGYEDEITWLAATKFGYTSRVLGYGPEFTCTFEDTYGPHPVDGVPWQWMGVKAGQALLGQDQKGAIQLVPCPGCSPDAINWSKWRVISFIDDSECAGPGIDLLRDICTWLCEPEPIGTQEVFQINGFACVFVGEATDPDCGDCVDVPVTNRWEPLP